MLCLVGRGQTLPWAGAELQLVSAELGSALQSYCQWEYEASQEQEEKLLL